MLWPEPSRFLPCLPSRVLYTLRMKPVQIVHISSPYHLQGHIIPMIPMSSICYLLPHPKPCVIMKTTYEPASEKCDELPLISKLILRHPNIPPARLKAPNRIISVQRIDRHHLQSRLLISPLKWQAQRYLSINPLQRKSMRQLRICSAVSYCLKWKRLGWFRA